MLPNEYSCIARVTIPVGTEVAPVVILELDLRNQPVVGVQSCHGEVDVALKHRGNIVN